MIIDKPAAIHGVSIAAITTAMAELGMASAVAAQWGQASDAVRIVWASGDVQGTGRQVADYCHRSWDAANEHEADGVVDVYWDDEAGAWHAEIEDRDDASRTVTAD